MCCNLKTVHSWNDMWLNVKKDVKQSVHIAWSVFFRLCFFWNNELEKPLMSNSLFFFFLFFFSFFMNSLIRKSTRMFDFLCIYKISKSKQDKIARHLANICFEIRFLIFFYKTSFETLQSAFKMNIFTNTHTLKMLWDHPQKYCSTTYSIQLTLKATCLHSCSIKFNFVVLNFLCAI